MRKRKALEEYQGVKTFVPVRIPTAAIQFDIDMDKGSLSDRESEQARAVSVTLIGQRERLQRAKFPCVSFGQPNV